MKALTLIQPWAWCITHLDKRVENRTWTVGTAAAGRFAIHAGLSHSGAEIVDDLEAEGIKVTGPIHFGAIVATVELVACVEGNADEYRFAQRWASKVVGDFRSRVHGLIRQRDGLWFSGPCGWVLDDVRVLSEPVLCRGAQGLWTLPEDVERLVIEREGTTR